MVRPDLVAREITNGIQFWFLICLAVAILVNAILSVRRNGFTFVEVSAGCLAVSYLSFSIMRGWIWAVLWNANHGYPPIFRDDYWLSWASTAGFIVFSSVGFFLLRSRWKGQSLASLFWPIAVSLIISISIPVIGHYGFPTVPTP